MKKVILVAFAISVIMSSCANNGNKAKTKDAENVEVIETSKTTTFKTIKEGSFVKWRASHLGGLQPRFGKIQAKAATFLVNNGVLSNATVVIDMSTLTVENFPKGAPDKEKLTGHLLSSDLFDVAKHPTSTFELTKLESATGDYNSKVTGNLTMLGVSKSITFNANVNVTADEVTIQSEDFSVDRTDWGLTYHVEGSEGVPVDYLIANDIGFTIQVSLAK